MENNQMKSLKSKVACAVLGLGLCLGSLANAAVPVAMAPAAAHNGTAAVTSRAVIIIVVTRPMLSQQLEHVDQAAEFDRTN
jgi:hypothetical protein